MPTDLWSLDLILPALEIENPTIQMRINHPTGLSATGEIEPVEGTTHKFIAHFESSALDRDPHDQYDSGIPPGRNMTHRFVVQCIVNGKKEREIAQTVSSGGGGPESSKPKKTTYLGAIPKPAGIVYLLKIKGVKMKRKATK